MQIVVLFALAAAFLVMKRQSIGSAVLNVYLPVLLLVPPFYSLRLPHLPALTAADMAVFPIGLAVIGRYVQMRQVKRADIWLALFVVGVYYSELSNTGAPNAGLVLYGMLATGIMPYLIGRIICEEDGMREQVVRRMVILLFVVGVLCFSEYRLGMNLFTRTFGVFFPDQKPWVAQIRGGLVRASGPYMAAILAGMVMSVGVIFSLWLGYVEKQRGNERKYLGVRRSTILTLGILAGLGMTNSRGPWLGALLGFLISRIGRAKNIRRAAIVTTLICVIGGTVGYIKADQYTSGSLWDAKDIEQENAIYRRLLLDEYKPIIEKGGLFGYGLIDWPKVGGMNSIDNEFLFIRITQGELGYACFLLLALEVGIAVVGAIRSGSLVTDIYFYFCLGGSIAGLLFALTTVYMGGQSYPLFFLLVGWSQGLRQTQSAMSPALPADSSERFKFKRVFA
ncbi:O-antigen ligase family protein [Silvibacterium sp.]|uniref:O-antigen ligase family protein n=1 Tax=Silvibacterium sp. TaxID=1964179 RepID=UPI0039E68A39